MSEKISWGTKRARARKMRELSDDQRDEMIAAAGETVIDARGRFGDMQRQNALAHAYRSPPKPTGVA